MPWPHPPERVRDLMRQGAEMFIQRHAEWLDAFRNASQSASGMEAVVADPVLLAESERATLATALRWASANVTNPGEPVEPSLDPATLDIARDLVRRGLNESSLAAYRIGQATAWRICLDISFSLTSDTSELRELLDLFSHSLSDFVEGSLAAIADRMQAERDELIRGSHPERREVVALILEGAPIPIERAEARLGYKLSQTHTAAVVWSTRADSDLSQLEQAVGALARRARSRPPMTIVPGAATIWAWLPAEVDLDPQQLERDLEPFPGVRIALGSTAFGIEGFRRSHLDAATTQRALAELESDRRVATFDEIQLAALITSDRDRADQFVRQTLGDLANADAELRDTVLTFVQEQGNVTRTAARMYTHRNTVLRRLARAGELLPKPLSDNALHVAAALDVAKWRGAG